MELSVFELIKPTEFKLSKFKLLLDNIKLNKTKTKINNKKINVLNLIKKFNFFNIEIFFDIVFVTVELQFEDIEEIEDVGEGIQLNTLPPVVEDDIEEALTGVLKEEEVVLLAYGEVITCCLIWGEPNDDGVVNEDDEGWEDVIEVGVDGIDRGRVKLFLFIEEPG